MNARLLAYIFIYAVYDFSSVVIPQYDLFDDGSLYFREGSRSGYHVLDQAITPTGFAGVENTDWKNVSKGRLPV